MERLRREEEARAYERMLNPPNLRFPSQPAAFDPYAAVLKPSAADDVAEDTIAAMKNESDPHLMVLLNILLTVFGTAAAVWFAARWWSVTARIFLSLGAAIFVAIADVVIYSVFVWRVKEGRGKVKKEEGEVRQVVKTWVVGGEGAKEEGGIEGPGLEDTGEATGTEKKIRRRRNRPPS